MEKKITAADFSPVISNHQSGLHAGDEVRLNRRTRAWRILRQGQEVKLKNMQFSFVSASAGQEPLDKTSGRHFAMSIVFACTHPERFANPHLAPLIEPLDQSDSDEFVAIYHGLVRLPAGFPSLMRFEIHLDPKAMS